MADTKISALGAIPALAGDDVLPIVDDTDTTTKKVSITQLDGRYLSEVVEDTTPQLGGDLDLNGNVIIGLEIGTDVQAYDADLTTIAAANNGSVLAATTASFTTADEAKLDGIEAGADVSGLVPVTTQVDDYTLALADVGTWVEVNAATAKAITIPPQSSVAWSDGASIGIRQVGAGGVSLTAGAGVTIRNDTALSTAYSSMVLNRRAQDDWVVVVSGATSGDAELAALAGLTSAANKIPMFSGSGTATVIDFKDEDDMVSDSATAVPSQQSVKAYVDSASGGGAIRVEDEGSSVVAAATGINFAGAGVTVTDAGSNEALVTIPGGGSSAGFNTTGMLPGFTYQTGQYFRAYQTVADIDAAVADNNILDRTVLIPFIPPTAVTVSHAGVEVVTGAASETVKVAVYSSDGTGGLANTVLDSVSFDTTSTGYQEVAFGSNVAFSAGVLYWVGINRSSSTPLLRSMAPQTSLGVVGPGASLHSDGVSAYVVSSDTHSSYPGSTISSAPAASSTVTTIPHIVFKVA